MTRLMTMILAILVLGVGVPNAQADFDPRKQLAAHFLRTALISLEGEPFTHVMGETALLMLRNAVELDPESQEIWRVYYNTSRMMERDDLCSSALTALARLDPRDEVIRLLRLSDVIEQANSVEERIATYEKLLSDSSIKEMGELTASRLALDLASLHWRRGDSASFTRWLSKAVALDSSNWRAVSTAAGYFRMNVDDAYAEAELLVSLLMANPVDIVTQAALARLLVDHGAYRAAVRIYDLCNGTRIASQSGPMPEVLADHALALWGVGNTNAALEIVRQYEAAVNEYARLRRMQAEPHLKPADVLDTQGLLHPTLATIRAAINERRGNALAVQSRQSAMNAYRSYLTSLAGQQTPDVALIAQTALEAAFVALVLGDDVHVARDLIAMADGIAPLHDAASLRFAGWIMMRTGNDAEALQLLTPLAPTDPAAQLGLALLHLEAGRKREAARSFLAVAQAKPGTLMGIWAAEHLAALIGTRLPASPEAERLEKLIDGVPRVIDRLPNDPSLAVSLRVTPTKTEFEPYEPITMNVDVTNNMTFPLGIGPESPIRPQIAIVMFASIPNQPSIQELPPLIIDIDRRLRLNPRETMRFTIDLRRHRLNEVLNALPLRGATIRMRTTLNYSVEAGAKIRPGLLGVEHETAPFRVNGVRVTVPWIEASITGVRAADSARNDVDLVLLSHVVTFATRSGESAADVQQLVNDADGAIAEGFPKMPATTQAWIAAVLPSNAIRPSTLDACRRSNNRYVTMMYLLHHLTGLDDPALNAAKRSEDVEVRALAEQIERIRTDRATAPQ